MERHCVDRVWAGREEREIVMRKGWQCLEADEKENTKNREKG
jgi:hypothetical protein